MLISDSANRYPSWVGAIYIFNLIVGTGALTIPAAFSNAGWLLGTIVIIALAFMSYVTATFTIEAMAAANGIVQWQMLQKNLTAPSAGEKQLAGIEEEEQPQVGDAPHSESELMEEERVHLLDSCDMNGGMSITPIDFYSIQNKVEMGQMATLFFNKVGLIFFYITICIYLYGDLAIYGTAIAKTMRDVTCTYFSSNITCDPNSAPSSPCWPGAPISRSNAYRLYLAIFLLVVGPFVFCNIQKTKALQILTSILRWAAFGIMVTLASIHLSKGTGSGDPVPFRLSGIPNLFGICIYSFMCHHSLPSLITPISNKNGVHKMMALNYFAILLFYLLVALTGVFSFKTLQDLYTLNFAPDHCNLNERDLPTNSVPIQYFLSLFPVFTLTTNFPIIGITLRNNLSQCASVVRKSFEGSRMGNIIFPFVAIIPPALISLATEDLQTLVGLTGSFAGIGVQYVIPTMLVVCAQRMCRSTLGTGIKNRHGSPFRHRAWIMFTILWTITCIVFIITNYIINGIS